MTPPPFLRNFGLGSTHLRIGEFDLRPALGRNSQLLRSEGERNAAAELGESRAVDHFLLTSTQSYRQLISENMRRYSVEHMEDTIQPLWDAARGGDNVGYYNLMQLHYGLVERCAPARIPSLSRQVSTIATEYVQFLGRQEMPTEEKLRYLFGVSRVVHLYLAFLLQQPSTTEIPEREATLNLLFSTLDSLDSEFQRYHGLWRDTNPANLTDFEGVARIVALRRLLHGRSSGDRRQAALDLAQSLTQHPPPANPARDNWRGLAERRLLDTPNTPNTLGQLQAFNRSSPTEGRAVALNALSLETLEVAAATLDQANEDPEPTIRSRYRDLGLVLSVSILNHPESTLEDLLGRLQNPANQAEIVRELQAASANTAIVGALNEATTGRDISALANTARDAAIHVQNLQNGPGSNILPILLRENLNQHPLRKIAEELSHLPSLAQALHLPMAGATSPAVQRDQAIELLRRGERGLAEIEAFRAGHPNARLATLSQSLAGGNEADEFASQSLSHFSSLLNRSDHDHEIAALHAVFSALDRGEDVGPGLRLSESTRGLARSLTQRIQSFGFRGSRVLSHLFSRSSLIGIAVGIVATEMLPAALIARAGLSGGLALGRPLVARGVLTLEGSALTGIGTGLGMSLVGSSLHQWERHRQGLSTHWGRDFASSAFINSLTFALSMPLSRVLNRALTPRFDATSAMMPLSLGRRLLLHGSNVALTGATSFGLGYLGRGIISHQWQTSGEEVAENFGSILMWETGSAIFRGVRRGAFGFGTELGPYRRAEVQRLTGRILEMQSGLTEHRAAIEGHLSREEAHYPGWLEQFGALLERGGHVPILEGSGRGQRLVLLPETALPARPTAENPDLTFSTPDPQANEANSLQNTFPQIPTSIVPPAFVETRLEFPRPARLPSMPLEPGTPVMVIENNAFGTRQGHHQFALPGVGEVAAFTHEGISKHTPPRNEDAYGLLRSHDNIVTVLAFDGAGGSRQGDVASAQGIRTVLARVGEGANLGQAFLDAHHSIREAGHGGYTVGTGLQIHPDGRVVVATVGDAQLLVARPREDGSYEVIRPFFPQNVAGLMRLAHSHISNTLEMNSHAMASKVQGALGTGDMVLTNALSPVTITDGPPNYRFEGIYHGELTLPEHADGQGAHRPFRAQAGDIFLLGSDGFHELFTRQQVAETMHGLREAGDVLSALRSETESRLNIYRQSHSLPRDDSSRAPITQGRFQGNWVNGLRDIYNAASGGERIGHVSPDNVVLVALRYDPQVAPVSSGEPGTPPPAPRIPTVDSVPVAAEVLANPVNPAPASAPTSPESEGHLESSLIPSIDNVHAVLETDTVPATTLLSAAPAAAAVPNEFPPLVTPATRYYLQVGDDPNAPYGFLNLLASSSGRNRWVVGREHFPFLEAVNSRVIRRSHFEITRDEAGQFTIRDLPRSGIANVDHHGTFQPSMENAQSLERVPSDSAAPLPVRRAAEQPWLPFWIGHRSEPLGLNLNEFPTLLDPTRSTVVPVEPSLASYAVSLPVGGRQRLGNLAITRAENGTYRLEGSSDHEMQIHRSVEGDLTSHDLANGSDHPTIGEPGETIRVVVNDRRTQIARVLELALGAPAAQRELTLVFNGSERHFPLGEDGSVSFGKNFQPDLFLMSWVSRNHFRVVRGEGTHTLEVHSQFGLEVNGVNYAPGARVNLSAGEYTLGFHANPATGDIERSFRLRIPPIQ